MTQVKKVGKIQGNRRITVPDEFMREHKLIEGDYIAFLEVKDRIVIVPLSATMKPEKSP